MALRIFSRAVCFKAFPKFLKVAVSSSCLNSVIEPCPETPKTGSFSVWTTNSFTGFSGSRSARRIVGRRVVGRAEKSAGWYKSSLSSPLSLPPWNNHRLVIQNEIYFAGDTGCDILQLLSESGWRSWWLLQSTGTQPWKIELGECDKV